MWRTARIVAQLAAVLLLLGLLSGYYTIAPSEDKNFVAQSIENRIMNDIQRSWDIRPGTSEVCVRVSKTSLSANSLLPVAYAV